MGKLNGEIPVTNQMTYGSPIKSKSTCVECGAELKWGGFAHNQDTCWECFKEQFLKICNRHTVNKKERDLLYYLMGVAAGQYGYEF